MGSSPQHSKFCYVSCNHTSIPAQSTSAMLIVVVCHVISAFLGSGGKLGPAYRRHQRHEEESRNHQRQNDLRYVTEQRLVQQSDIVKSKVNRGVFTLVFTSSHLLLAAVHALRLQGPT